MSKENKNVYIVLSQTPSIISKLISLITGDQYCHVSISLDDELETMYSFGRRLTYYPFYGGYVKESPHYGTFKRFINAKIAVLKFSVSEETYESIRLELEQMYREKNKFGYNYRGVLGALFKKKYQSQNKFYCSEFVNYILVEHEIYKEGVLPEIIHPVDFYKAFSKNIVFKGSFSSFLTEKVKLTS